MNVQSSGISVHAWFSPGGNPRLWGDGGTYTEAPWHALPPIAPASLDGSFQWLPEPAAGLDRMMYGQDDGGDGPIDPSALLDGLSVEADRAGLALPRSFVTFMSSPALFTRVPSCTACYFELGARLVRAPNVDGPERLLRFMNDQQCCLLWYLLLAPGERHRVVCAVPEWREEGGDTLEDSIDPSEVAICASSFEEFIKRFWIENTLWYAVHKRRPPIEGELRGYLEAAAGRSRR